MPDNDVYDIVLQAAFAETDTFWIKDKNVLREQNANESFDQTEIIKEIKRYTLLLCSCN